MKQIDTLDRTEDESWHPSMGKCLPDGSIEYCIVGQYHRSFDGRYHREYAYWAGTNDWCADAGPQSSDHYPGEFIRDFAEDFVCDASDCFEEGKLYVVRTTLLTDLNGVSKDVWAFRCSEAMFD